jgi:hypothetical protein
MPRSPWRRIVVLLRCLVGVSVWTVCAYQVVAGETIYAQVLSCGSGSHRSCEVAWSHGSTHGTTNVEGDGYLPGSVMPLYYTPGLGVTPRNSALIVTFVLPLGLCAAIVSVLWLRRGRVTAY